MKKKKSRKKIIILSVVVVVVALLVFGYVRMQARIAENAKTTYDTVKVQRGDIEVRVKGAGAVQPLSDDSVYAAAAGTVVDVNAEDGDVVSAGDIIATFESRDLESQRDSLQTQIDDLDASINAMRSATGSDYIKSPVEGTVKALYAANGDSVDAVMDEYGALAIVSPDDLMKAVVTYDGVINAGDKVTVTKEGKSVTGTVKSVDALNSAVTVSFPGKGFSEGDMVQISVESGLVIGQSVITVENPVYITGRGGTIDKIYKTEGKTVSRRGNLFRLDGDILSSDLYAKIDQRAQLEDDLADVESKLASLTVRAGTDGVISNLSLSRDQIVQAGVRLFTVQSNSQVKIDVDIDELDIADIKEGQTASVTFDALPDKEFTATVKKINPVGVSVNNVTHFTVTLELDSAAGVMLGMSADVEIVSKTAKDALYIPIEAIQVVNGEKYVVLAQDVDNSLDYTPATHKVTTGITDGVSIEILSGLNEGDEVAVPQVRELTLQEQQMQMWSRQNGGGSRSSDTQAPQASE